MGPSPVHGQAYDEAACATLRRPISPSGAEAKGENEMTLTTFCLRRTHAPLAHPRSSCGGYQLNVYRGELELRPPAAPTTQGPPMVWRGPRGRSEDGLKGRPGRAAKDGD